MSSNQSQKSAFSLDAAGNIRQALEPGHDLRKLVADINVSARLGVRPLYLETAAASVQAQLAMSKFDLRLSDLARSLGTTATAAAAVHRGGSLAGMSDAIKSLRTVSPDGVAGVIAEYQK